MENLITYDLADDFIQRLASFIDENYIKKGEDISRLAIVFGGRRPALFLQKELSNKYKRAFLAPRFFSIDDFVEYTLEKKMPLTPISDIDACFIIYQLARKHAPAVLKGREAFSQFLPWAKEILGFIEQLDLEEIKVKSLKDIQLNAAIGYDVPESINVLLTHIVALRDIFHEVLMEKQAYSRGLMYQLAASLIPQADFEEFDRIFFCNFFYLSKTEKEIIKSLYEKKKGILFFQGDAKDWTVLEKISKSLNGRIQPPETHASDFDLSVDSGFDLHSQIGLVREKLKTIDDLDKTVIVLPDPDSLIPLLSEITPLVKDFNVSMGYPAKRSSLVSLLDDLSRAQETKKGDAYYAKDYLRLLSHPLIKNLTILKQPSVTRILVHKIEEVLTGAQETPLSGSLFVKLSDILEEDELYEAALDTARRMDVEATASDLKTIVKQLHRSLFESWEDFDNFYGFSQCLEEFLDLLLNRSFLSKYPLNLKIVEKILGLAEEFKNSSYNKEAFLKEDIFKIFKKRLDNEMVSFSGSPLKGLQILGLQETRSLSFENVVILDVNESVLPKLKVYEPLIPRDVMMSLGFNRLEKEEEIQRYHFMRLISSAKRVFLFYEASEKKEKSRFIEELIWDRQKATGALDVLSIPKASFKMKVSSGEIEVKKNPLVVNFLKDYRYSASSLNIYLHCPLRFYYQHVLGLNEKEDLLEEPEATDTGTFIHDLLEETFKKFVGRRPNIGEDFKKYFFDRLNKKFEDEFERKIKSDAFLIKEVLDFRLGRFLDNERHRPVKQLLCVEKVYEDKIRVKEGYFRFKSKIDRIDKLNDDSLLIIDYKTGSTDVMPSRPERLETAGFSRESIKNIVKSFQLPLYFYFVRQAEKNVSLNAALYNLRNTGKNSGLTKLFKDEEKDAQKERVSGIFMKALECVLGEILDPGLPFKADQEDAYYCSHCPFFYLCR